MSERCLRVFGAIRKNQNAPETGETFLIALYCPEHRAESGDAVVVSWFKEVERRVASPSLNQSPEKILVGCALA
jgi:hypothetical protein